jgi:hypothetical protein
MRMRDTGTSNVPTVADRQRGRPLVTNYEGTEFLDWKIRGELFEKREVLA